MPIAASRLCVSILAAVFAVIVASPRVAAQFEGLSPGDRRALVEGIVAATELQTAEPAADTPAEATAQGSVAVSVKGESGRPLAGVDVLVLPADGWNVLPRDERVALVKAAGRGRTARQVALARRLGRRYRSDQEGQVRFAADGPVQVLLLDERTVDAAIYRAGGDPIVFRVDDRPRVLVRVVDGIGRPAEGEAVSLYRGAEFLAAETTGAQGMASFVLPAPSENPTGENPTGENPTGEDPEGEDAVGPYADLRLELGHRVVGIDATGDPVSLEGFEPGDPPLRLALPPMGMVRFILYGADEKPVDRLESAYISFSDGRSRTTVSANSTEGDSAMFERVPLDTEVSVTARVEGLIGQLEFSARGPRHPGELVIVEGRLATGPSILSGRVLDLAGDPISGREIGLALVGTSSTQALDGKLGKDGRFHLVLPETIVGESWIDPLLYVAVARDGGPDLMAAVELDDLVDGEPGEVPTGRSRDLGDLQLQEPEVVVAGKLVDLEGEPLAGFAVTARHSIYGQSYSSSTRRFDHSTETAEDGSFELREVRPLHAPLRLSFSGEGFAVEGNVEAGLGEKDLRVEARPVGAIDVALEGAPIDGLDRNVTLTRDGAPADVTHRIYLRDGKGSSNTIPAGTYDLELSVSHRDEGLTLEGIEVPAGGKANDARLAGIPWREQFRLIRIVVRDSKQQPIASSGTIWRYVSSGNGRAGSGSRTDSDGVVTFLCPKQNCEIAADVDGYFKQTVDADKDEIVFDLKPAPPVVVWLPEDVELPKGLEVNFHLGKGNSASYSDTSVRPGQKVTFYPDEEGDHTVTLQLSWRHGQQQRQVWNRFRSLRQVPVEIGASAESIEVEFEVDEELLERLATAAEELGLGDEDGGRR